jgi:LysM repeat protein
LFVTLFLVGCGRLITPTPEIISNIETATPITTLTPTLQPTATPRIATPIASPTPTVTPTPVIYTVQPGDTLLKIAIDFNQTTEAIQEANGLVDPRFLQIGQTLVIPPPKAEANTPPTPTPTPPPLTVTRINFQESAHGALWCLGTVENPGNEPLTEVVVEASLLDGAGVLLAREAAFTQLDVVQPGASIPFAILFESPPTEFAQYQVLAVAGVPLAQGARYYFDLETFDLRGAPAGINSYRIQGQLRNWGSKDVETIRLVAVLYNGDNRVLAQRQAELAVTLLKAGATTPFQIDLIVPKGVVDHFEVLVQGLQVE